MKSFLFTTLLSLTILGSSAQSFNYIIKDQWFDIPEKHEVKKEFALASAVGILDLRNIEYKLEGKEISLSTTYHRIIRINDDKGIEMCNKIYVPVYPNAQLTELKARTILSNNKVIDIPTEKIKEIEEEGRKYKLFAMEGVEKGAEIEYIYTVKKAANYFGSEVFQTSSIPYQNIQFSLQMPTFLKFDAKGYNGLKVSKDTVINDKRVIVAYDNNVVEIEDEKYAVREPYLERVDYKLSYNLNSSSDVRLYTWKDFAKRAYLHYTAISSKEEKPLISFIEQINLRSAYTMAEKVPAIEDYIKSNINIDKDLAGDDVSSIEKIIKKKSANHEGITRLFAVIFEKLGYDYRIVFVSRRDELPLDEDLENWNRVDETIFYFPSTGKYLSPFSVELRYPYIPSYWAGTKGLFLKGTSIGDYKTAVGSFDDIAMEPFDQHSENMETVVTFDPTLDTLLINSRQILRGYGASMYRPIYTFLPKDKQDAANIEILKAVANSTDIKNIKVENSALTSYLDNKPLIISGDIKSSSLIERAGNKVLLKIGEIIGPQTQMYQEKPRQLPVQLPFPHVLKRKITLNIPEGYVVKNINDLNLSVEYKDGNEATMGFVSSYNQTGNIITIDINESYKKIFYPLSQFEDFKKVINAAADFNKVVLVLEKKS